MDGNLDFNGKHTDLPSRLLRVVGHLVYLNIRCDVADTGKSLPQVARLCLRSFRREAPSHTSWS
jgi:hypothetical protein